MGELRQSSHTAGANFKHARYRWDFYHQNTPEGGGKQLSIWGPKGNIWEQGGGCRVSNGSCVRFPLCLRSPLPIHSHVLTFIFF